MQRSGPPHRGDQIKEPYDDIDLNAPIPTAPDGGIQPGYAQPAPLPPPATEADHMCLRGPCRHFWSLRTSFEHGNAPGTFEALGLPEPQKKYEICLVNPGYETELTGDAVHYCSRWSPITPIETLTRKLRQKAWNVRKRLKRPQ